MATVEQVLIRKAEELRGQLEAVHTTLRLLQRQPSKNGGAMAADVAVRATAPPKRQRPAANGPDGKPWKVSTALADTVVGVLEKAGRVMTPAEVTAALGGKKHLSSVSIALRRAESEGKAVLRGRGQYAAK